MVKVTVEYEDNTQIVERNLVLLIGNDIDGNNVDSTELLYGDVSDENIKKALWGIGKSTRKLLDAVQAETGRDMHLAFLDGLALECAPKPNPIQRLLAKFRKEDNA